MNVVAPCNKGYIFPQTEICGEEYSLTCVLKGTNRNREQNTNIEIIKNFNHVIVLAYFSILKLLIGAPTSVVLWTDIL